MPDVYFIILLSEQYIHEILARHYQVMVRP